MEALESRVLLANSVVIYDGTLTVTTAYPQFDPAPATPANWTSPVNYTQGTIDLNLVITKPNADPFYYRIQFYVPASWPATGGNTGIHYYTPLEGPVTTSGTYHTTYTFSQLAATQNVAYDFSQSTSKLQYSTYDSSNTGIPDGNPVYPYTVHITETLIPPGGATNTPPSAAITTPSSPQAGNISFNYTLTDAESNTCTIATQYSTDSGSNWHNATAAAGSATSGLSSSPGGTAHTFVWASGTDLGSADNTHVEFRITPTDTAVGTAGTTGTFTVNDVVGPAAKLVFGVLPASATVGVAVNPSIVVDVEDASGNIVTGNGSSVTLAVKTGPGTAMGTTTVAASNGVATLSNVEISAAGTYTLLASDGLLTSATSGNLTVAAELPGIAIDSGGGASGNFVADTDYDYGGVYSSSATINTTGVTNPAPQTVYQTERFGNLTYTIPNLSVGAPYLVRLHFAELYWTAAGERLFNVLINGTQVLTNFDIFAAAGGADKAVVEQFTATATAGGSIAIQFVDVVDMAKIGGIEIIPAPPLALTTPATAVSVNVGGTYNIQWTGGNPTDTVQIWTEGGPNNVWTELSASLPDSQGQFAWNTTGVLHGWYYFQADDIPASGTPYDVVSPNYLHVVAPSVTQAPTVTIINPVLAGEHDAQGTNYTINWTTTEQGTDTNPLFVQLWVHNGTTNAWSILPNANAIATGASGSYVWNTTNVAPGWYAFTAHITDGDLWGAGGPAANSPGWVDITVPSPTITYLTPTGGQSAAAGGSFSLQWSVSGLPTSDISSSTMQIWAQYLSNGTAVWTEIAASVDAANGSYSWTVPTSPGSGTYYAFSMWMNYGADWWIQASANWVQVT